MTRARPRPLWLRGAHAVVWLAARLAPADRRDRFLQEWRGEIDAEGDAGGRWRVVRTSLGAFADARTLRHLVDPHQRREPMHVAATRWLAGLAADLVLAARSLRRTPGFALVAVITLGVGIGGSAAMFTLVRRVVLDPLAYPDAARLVRLDNLVPGVGADKVWNLSLAQYVYYMDRARTLESIGLYRWAAGNVVTTAGPRRVNGVSITASLVPLLGLRASTGRTIQPADDVPGATAIAMVSHAFWTDVLGGRPEVVGTAIRFNEQPVVIAGVMATDVTLPGISDRADLWFPLRVDRAGPFRNNHVFPAVARLAAGASVRSAERELTDFLPQLITTFPQAYTESFVNRYGFHTQVLPLKDDVLGDVSRNLWVLFGAVGLVLVIACANVANVFAVRMDGRRRELAVRAALGAPRTTLARHVLAEGLALALGGAGLAIILCTWAVPALTALAPAGLPRIHDVAVDAGTIGYVLAVAFMAALALAAYPAIAHAGPAAVRHLRDTTRSTTAGRDRQRLRGVLIVLQMAFALTLAVGAGLLIATVVHLRGADVGVSPKGVALVDLYLSRTRYPNDEAIWRFDREVLARVRALPGVTAAGMSEEVPVDGGFGCTVQGFEEQAVYDRLKDAGRTTCAGQETVSPGALEALGVPILEGRAFSDADNDDPSRGAVVVSRAFADRFWPGQSALGKAVAPNGYNTGLYQHVVGVVGDVARSSDAGAPPLSQKAIAIYYPMRTPPEARWKSDWWPGYMTLIVRTGLDDPSAIVPAVRRAVSELDPEVPLANLTTMEGIIGRAMAQVMFVSMLLTIAAAVALLLAALGLYGTISYIVARRTREIGLRLAIGAQPGEVQRAVVFRALALAGGGLAFGVVLALGAARTLRAVLAGIEPTDVRIYVAASALLLVIAALASWLPARRAARIDPTEALRME